MDGPLSSYSLFAIHICWKVDRLARMEPPIQTLYLRSGGATTLIFMALGASAVISLLMRSAIPARDTTRQQRQARARRRGAGGHGARVSHRHVPDRPYMLMDDGYIDYMYLSTYSDDACQPGVKPGRLTRGGPGAHFTIRRGGGRRQRRCVRGESGSVGGCWGRYRSA